MMLEAAEVQIGRGGVTILEGVSLSADAGVTGLVGPNGGGKTSLLRVLAGLARAEAGTVRIDGKSPFAMRAGERAKVLGYLPQRAQDAFLCPSVADEFERAADLAGAEVQAALGRCGLAGLAQRHPLSLSEGQRRRAAFALATMGSPKVLLLDEPTAGLDHDAGRQLLGELRDLAAQGTCVLLATHDSDAIEICDRCFSVAHRRLVEAASPEAER
jgi:ABC-type multidrug transport system ATPase subunit